MKMRGIFKRGDWYYIRFADITGKIICKSTHSKEFKAAESLLIRCRAEVRQGKHPELITTQKHTLKDIAPQYLKWAERQKDFKNKTRIVNALVKRFGALPLARVTSLLLEQYQSERLAAGNAPATVNRAMACLSSMVKKSVEWHLCGQSVIESVRRVKHLPECGKRLRYLSDDERQGLIEYADPQLKPILITLLNTGMRRSEVLGLKWDSVDLRNRFILLDQGQTKNSKRREVPINDTLAATLRDIPRRIDIPWVFFNPQTGSRYIDVKRSFHTACRRAGVKDFRLHDARHDFCSRLVMAGVDLRTVQELVGHGSIIVTTRYAHLSPLHKKSAVDILDAQKTANPTEQKLVQI